ncbi:uncharacterized protein LOC112091421 [Morus notabilis]|uniref:uncharacterized protein LOC112091421 n=1 Tax=Morus notabilis TaxID=981085 RepID=UPI000CECE5FC|nr:uncharacterized protein LOC112091421 [Morus notabilis]
MATCFAPPLSFSGGSQLKRRELCSGKSNALVKTPKLAIQRKSSQLKTTRTFSVRAEYRDGNRGGGGDFFAGFILGGAVFGTLAYIFAPQVIPYTTSRYEIYLCWSNIQFCSQLTVDFPLFYGKQRTRQTLNEKISQLNSAIDNVSSRLRGGNNSPTVPVETDPEVEATM